MTTTSSHANWTVPLGQGERRITVRAETASGTVGEDGIVAVVGSPEDAARPVRQSPGGDATTIGAWKDRHVFGTQLGPNRSGRKW